MTAIPSHDSHGAGYGDERDQLQPDQRGHVPEAAGRADEVPGPALADRQHRSSSRRPRSSPRSARCSRSSRISRRSSTPTSCSRRAAWSGAASRTRRPASRPRRRSPTTTVNVGGNLPQDAPVGKHVDVTTTAYNNDRHEDPAPARVHAHGRRLVDAGVEQRAGDRRAAGTSPSTRPANARAPTSRSRSPISTSSRTRTARGPRPA